MTERSLGEPAPKGRHKKSEVEYSRFRSERLSNKIVEIEHVVQRGQPHRWR
jgi:hypothetical protein